MPIFSTRFGRQDARSVKTPLATAYYEAYNHGRMHLFSQPINSPLLIYLTVIYGICAAITAVNTCITHAKRVGYLSRNKAYIPAWTGVFAILLWTTWLAIFLLNWWYALALFAIKVSLKELSVLKYIGFLLLWPILDKEATSAVRTAVVAADDIKAMNAEWKHNLKAMSRELKNKARNSRV